MSRRQKLLRKISQNPKDVRFEELVKLLEWYGFELKRVRGSHYAYSRGPLNLVIPHRRPHVHSYIVKDVLKALEEIAQAEAASTDDVDEREDELESGSVAAF